MGAPQGAPLRASDGNANRMQPATLLIGIDGGSSTDIFGATIMTNLVISTTAIRQLDGLYNLNDLHLASGGSRKHQPSNFLRVEQTQELIAEIKSSDMRIYEPVKTQKGAKGGTFVCKELVYAYAMWISPKFNLAVIRAFDSMRTGEGQSPTLPESTKPKITTIVTILRPGEEPVTQTFTERLVILPDVIFQKYGQEMLKNLGQMLSSDIWSTKS